MSTLRSGALVTEFRTVPSTVAGFGSAGGCAQTATPIKKRAAYQETHDAAQYSAR
jgi:hypothetical protein